MKNCRYGRERSRQLAGLVIFKSTLESCSWPCPSIRIFYPSSWNSTVCISHLSKEIHKRRKQFIPRFMLKNPNSMGTGGSGFFHKRLGFWCSLPAERLRLTAFQNTAQAGSQNEQQDWINWQQSPYRRKDKNRGVIQQKKWLVKLCMDFFYCKW